MLIHTPGPWEWWTSNSWHRLRHSDRGVSTNVLMPIVCKDGQATIDVSPADAALIKAAPELLAAARLATGALLNADPGNPRDETGWARKESMDAWRALDSAIASATKEKAP